MRPRSRTRSSAEHLAGYAADVFECEDWAREDRPAHIDARLISPSAPTVLTPHIGSGVAQARREIELSAARSIVDVLSGRVPNDALNHPSFGNAARRSRRRVMRSPPHIEMA